MFTVTPDTPCTAATAFSTQPGISPATGQPGAVSVMSMSTLRSSSMSTCRSGRARRCRPGSPGRRRSSAPATMSSVSRSSSSRRNGVGSSVDAAGRFGWVCGRRRWWSSHLIDSSRRTTSRPCASASARASTSSGVLYRAKEARQVEVTPKRASSGLAQWVPARTATPERSIIVATSCGMRALHLEGDDRALVRRVAEDAQRVDAAQPLMGVGAQHRPRGRAMRSRPSPPCSRAPRRARSPATIGGVPASKRCGGSA